MADVQILRTASTGVPMNYTLPDTAELRLKAVYAEFDDNGAGSDWLPTVTILSDSGHEIARACEQEVVVTAGDDADVSWFPRVRRRRAGTTTATRCQLLGSANGTDTLTITLDAAVPSTGTLHVVTAQVTAPNGGGDGGSEISGASDSQGLGPWIRPAIPNPFGLIGNSRQTDPGNVWSLQVASCVRSCRAGDLGIGDTITVTWSTSFPADFHTAGLAIYQPAYNQAIKQYGSIQYAMGDSYPDTSPLSTRLSWDDDYGAFFSRSDDDSVMITAMGAYPAVAGFSPFYGSVIGERADGVVSIASACMKMCDEEWLDPGGTWPAGASGLTGCYQYGQPRTCTN